MGWDSLLDAMAERDEQSSRANPESEGHWDSDPEPRGSSFPFDDEEGDDDDDDELDEGGYPFDEDDQHPVQRRAKELAIELIHAYGQEEQQDGPVNRLIGRVLEVAGKLAGALNGRAGGYEPETGFVLAILKRCLDWLNTAAGACREIHDRAPDPAAREAARAFQQEILGLRDAIVELRREIKQS